MLIAVQQILEQVADQVIVKDAFLGLETVPKDPLDLASNDELSLKVEGSEQLKKVSDNSNSFIPTVANLT